MPIPLLALAAASALPKLYQAYKQNKAADDVTLQDSTTGAEREQLAMSRQAANSARLPGMGYQEARLGQVQAGALQNARLGARSSSDFLAAAGNADARRQLGEQQLGVQGLQYQDGSKRQLRQDLTTASARQQRDLDNYNREKAALTQASAENLSNGIGSLASYGALSNNMGAGGGLGGALGGAATAGGPSGSFGVPSMQYGSTETSSFAPGTATPAQLGIAQLPALPSVNNYGLNGYGADRYRYNLGRTSRRPLGY